MSESKADWRPMNTAPRDGTEIRLLWIGGEDEGHWRPFTSPEQVWKECPWHHGQSGEWSTRYGNATGDEVEPQGWLPMEPSHAHP